MDIDCSHTIGFMLYTVKIEQLMIWCTDAIYFWQEIIWAKLIENKVLLYANEQHDQDVDMTSVFLARWLK